MAASGWPGFHMLLFWNPLSCNYSPLHNSVSEHLLFSEPESAMSSRCLGRVPGDVIQHPANTSPQGNLTGREGHLTSWVVILPPQTSTSKGGGQRLGWLLTVWGRCTLVVATISGPTVGPPAAYSLTRSRWPSVSSRIALPVADVQLDGLACLDD